MIDYFEQWISGLEAELTATRRELEAVKKMPLNSSLPPSSVHPHAKAAPKREPSGTKPWGQPEHPKHERALIPTGKCDEIVTPKPKPCHRCDARLAGVDP